MKMSDQITATAKYRRSTLTNLSNDSSQQPPIGHNKKVCVEEKSFVSNRIHNPYVQATTPY